MSSLGLPLIPCSHVELTQLRQTPTIDISLCLWPLPTLIITFRVSRRRREMHCGHARLRVCLSAAACLHYCTDPDVTWGSGRGCPLVVHYWADLQSVHRLRCCSKLTRKRNVREYMFVLTLCLAVNGGHFLQRFTDRCIKLF